MEKQRYYITLQSGTTVAEIRDVKGESTYDFEIEATPIEAGMMRDLFDHCAHGDYMMWIRDGHVLWTDMPDEDNDEYDDNLREIYRMIYRLGTPKTKQDLEQMGLVKALGLDKDEMPQELKNPGAGQVEDPSQGPWEGILER
ncbi:hypothetical protein [Brevibacillus borstelensis]|uniref:hypothetical protein n=1 Tax=Brevibacillus borstelensis TaxID=45462 RepID=UPI0030BFC327